jgi:pseudouridine kinase
MALAVNDMEITKEITPEYLEKNLTLLNGAQLVVVDANIPAESIAFLAEQVQVPIFADPVSVTKAEKFRPVLGKLHTLKPNKLEAELLSGIPIHTDEDLVAATKALLSTGLHRVFISLGTEGVWAADQNEMLKLPCYPTQVRNATGAGDAFVAGLVWAYLKGSDLRTSTMAGSAASSISIEGEETINEQLSEEALIARMNMEVL